MHETFPWSVGSCGFHISGFCSREQFLKVLLLHWGKPLKRWVSTVWRISNWGRLTNAEAWNKVTALGWGSWSLLQARPGSDRQLQGFSWRLLTFRNPKFGLFWPLETLNFSSLHLCSTNGIRFDMNVLWIQQRGQEKNLRIWAYQECSTFYKASMKNLLRFFENQENLTIWMFQRTQSWKK